MNNNKSTINLQLTSSIIFILSALVSLSIIYDEKLKQDNKNGFYTKEEALNISFYNRIFLLVSILISFYVATYNYKISTEEKEKYKTSLLLSTSTLTLISGLILIYVSYLNKNENTLTASDTQNTLI